MPTFAPFERFQPFSPFGQKLGSSLPHVADANARLSLDPTTHPTDTFQVYQDDTDPPTLYTFTGPGADADAGLWIDLVAYSARGTSKGKNYYNEVGQADDTAVSAIVNIDDGHGSSAWHRYDGVGFETDATTSDSTYPWTATWLNFSPYQRNPIASEDNWTP